MGKAFSLVELLAVIAICAMLAAIAVPNFREAKLQSKTAQVFHDQKRMAMALDTYKIDHDQYPTYFPIITAPGYDHPTAVSKNINRAIAMASGYHFVTDPNEVPSFSVTDSPGHVIGLTTPVSYLPSYPEDQYSNFPGYTYAFCQSPREYLIWSYGPDATYQLAKGAKAAEYIVHGSQSLPSTYLIAGPHAVPVPAGAPTNGGAFTYDPTNGTGSVGDIWRTRRGALTVEE